MTNDNDGGHYSLSRRKALAGLGTIGAAAGLGGVGTYAQLTDTEAVGVSFSAGELNGHVEYSATYNGDDVSSSDGTFNPEEPVEGDDGNSYVPVAYKLEDVKPGDYGSIVFEATVETNPAWPIMCLGKANSEENGIVEPEEYAEDQANPYLGEADKKASGELGENLLMVPFYDTDVDSSFFDTGGPSDGALDNYGSGTNPTFWDNATNGNGKLFPRSLDNLVKEDPDNQLRQGTVQFNEESDNGSEVYVAESLGDLDGDANDTASFALNGGHENGANISGVSPLGPGDTLNFGFDWHIPYSTGNEIQTDSVDVYFTWAFQQLRHSEGPQGPFTYAPGNYADSDPTEGDDPTNTSG